MTTTLHLLSGGAAQGLVGTLAPEFERARDCAVTGEFGAVGAMREKLAAGAPADMLILTRALIDTLAAEGAVVADTIRDVGPVATAVGARAGDPAPDVSTREALARALRAAGEIHYPDPERATAGIHVAKVVRELGLADELCDRIRLHPNGATAMRALVASPAPGALCLTQATEILSTPGGALVAALPQGCDLTTTYTAAVTTRASQAGLAADFIAHLSAPGAAATRDAAGFR
jgi:molybdate transport system substrate-binding protein